MMIPAGKTIFTFFTLAIIYGCHTLPPVAEPLEIKPPKITDETITATAPSPPPQPPLPEPTPAPNLPPAKSTEQTIKKPSTYLVSEGELLWSIAKRPEIYADPLLWPLIYQANRDQIKDPRHIYAGQILSLPRNFSANELEEARNRARKSDFFSHE